MARYIIYADPDDGVLTGAASPTFSTARDTVASATGTGTGFTVSQQSDGTTYTFYQSDVHFDLSAVSAVGAASLTLTPFTPVYTTADVVEVRSYAWTAPLATSAWVPGSSIAATCPALLGSITTGTGGTWPGGSSSAATIALSATGLTGGAVNGLLLNVASQRAGTDNGILANKSGAGIYSADQAGTSQDPTLTITSGTYLRSTGAVTQVASGNLALAYPTTASGDVLAAIVIATDNVVSTMPSGWTLKQGTNNGTGLRVEVWEQTARATGTESGTVTVTRASGLSAQGWMVSIAGAIASGEAIEAIAASANASSSTVTFPALTTLTAGADVFALQALAGAATFGVPGGTDPAFTDDLDASYDPRPPLAPDYTNTAGGGTLAASSLVYSYGSSTSNGGTAVIALNVKSGTVTMTAPTGWALVTTRNLASSPTDTLFTLTKVITAGETGSITLNWGTSVKYALIERGFANTNGLQVAAVATQNASGTTASLGAATPNAATGVRIAIVGLAAAQSLSSATGFSNITSVTSTGGNASTQGGVSMAVATAYPPSGVSTGTTTLNLSGTSSGAAAVHLVLAASNPTASPVSAAFSDGTKTSAGAITAPTATASVAGVNTGILFAVTPAASGPSPQTATSSVATQAWSALAPSLSLGGIVATAALAIRVWTALTPTVSTGAVSAAPTVATSAWTTTGPTTSAGAVTTTAGTATGAWTVVTPTAAVGSVPLSATTTVAVASWTTLAPTPLLGAVSATSAVATRGWSVVSPIMTVGAVTVTPSASVQGWAVGSPSIALGGITASPSGATSTWSVSAATSTVGGVSTSPSLTTRAWSVVTPGATLGNAPISVTTTVATASWVVSAPTTSLGAVSATPALAVRPWATSALTSAVGSVTASPAVSVRSWTASAPSVTLGALTVTPSLATGLWATLAPSPSVGGVLATPSASARAWTITSPATTAGDVTVTPDPAVVVWTVADPTTRSTSATPTFTVLGVWSAFGTTPVVSVLDTTPVLTVGATSPAITALDATPQLSAMLTTPIVTGIVTDPTLTPSRSTTP